MKSSGDGHGLMSNEPAEYPILVDGYGRQFVKVPVEDFVKMEVEAEARDAALREQTRIIVEPLAKALIDSGLIARYSDYALRAHPTTMQREDPEELARGWARDILAALPRTPRRGGQR